MASTPPVATSRTVPSGTSWKMPEGYQTEITFSLNAAIAFWEETVTPPEADGGEPIDTTTQLNTRWHTMSPRQLVKSNAFTVEAAYDPAVLPTLYVGAAVSAWINKPQTITITFPDTSQLCFYGYLQKVAHSPMKQGEFPKLTLTIVPTHWDPVGMGEQGPVYTAMGGTHRPY